jgi:hypothetical protein
MGRTLWCDDEGLCGLVERRGDVRHLGPLVVAEAVVHLRLRADEAQDRLGHALHTQAQHDKKVGGGVRGCLLIDLVASPLS